VESSFRSRLRASFEPLCSVAEIAESPSASLVTGSAATDAGVESLRRRPSGIRQLLAKLANVPPALAPSPSPPGLVTVGNALVDIVRLRLRFSSTFDKPSEADTEGDGVDVSLKMGVALVIGGEEEEDASDVLGRAISRGGTGEFRKSVSSARAIVAVAFVGEAVATCAGMFDTVVDGNNERTECVDPALGKGDCGWTREGPMSEWECPEAVLLRGSVIVTGSGGGGAGDTDISSG